MKRVSIAIALTIFVLLAAEASLFTGSWIVEEEGMTITFADSGKVSYDSEDESVVGDGTFSYTDSTLTADIVNDDMAMTIVYLYESKDESVKVKTKAVIVEGDTLDSSDEWYTITRKK